MRSQALDRASQRIVWVRMGGLAIVLLLAGRAAHLTVAHTRARDLYDMQIRTDQNLSAARGTIFDRDGRELAITTDAASIYALPRLIEDHRTSAADAVLTANVSTGEPEHVAQEIDQREARFGMARHLAAIHGQGDLVVAHAAAPVAPFARLRADRRARSVMTRATRRR